MGPRISASYINAQDMAHRITPLPGGGVILQLFSPGAGDLCLYFPRVQAASRWWDSIGLSLYEASGRAAEQQSLFADSPS